VDPHKLCERSHIELQPEKREKGAVENKISRWSLTALFRPKVEEEPPATTHRPANPYHAVSVEHGLFVCAEAKKVEGIRFLSREAPPLPFRKCDSEQCTCRYRHHADRRQGDRRHRDFWSQDRHWQGDERRESSSRGRRSTDS
jgi:hypothetical protein